VFDRVRHPTAVALKASIGEGAVEEAACRSDEGTPGSILLGARLLADQHDVGIGRPDAPHRLRRMAVEGARRAARGGRGQLRQALRHGRNRLRL
jgi:hypothetical protein